MAASRKISRRDAMRRLAALDAAGTLPLGLAAPAQGKFPDQPIKPIKLIVALAGSGIVAMMARAEPDGYTLTVSPASFLSTHRIGAAVMHRADQARRVWP